MTSIAATTPLPTLLDLAAPSTTGGGGDAFAPVIASLLASASGVAVPPAGSSLPTTGATRGSPAGVPLPGGRIAPVAADAMSPFAGLITFAPTLPSPDTRASGAGAASPVAAPGANPRVAVTLGGVPSRTGAASATVPDAASTGDDGVQAAADSPVSTHCAPVPARTLASTASATRAGSLTPAADAAQPRAAMPDTASAGGVPTNNPVTAPDPLGSPASAPPAPATHAGLTCPATPASPNHATPAHAVIPAKAGPHLRAPAPPTPASKTTAPDTEDDDRATVVTDTPPTATPTVGAPVASDATMPIAAAPAMPAPPSPAAPRLDDPAPAASRATVRIDPPIMPRFTPALSASAAGRRAEGTGQDAPAPADTSPAGASGQPGPIALASPTPPPPPGSVEAAMAAPAAARPGGTAAVTVPSRLSPPAADTAPTPVATPTVPPPAAAAALATVAVPTAPPLPTAIATPAATPDRLAPSSAAADGPGTRGGVATPPRVAPLPANPAPAAPAILPALQAFGAALHRAAAAERRPPRDPAIEGVAAPVPAGTIVAATDPTPVDTTRTRWPEAMVARIEALRDQQNAGDTRIRLHPDALGTIDVTLRQDAGGTHVQLHATEPATAALLADARSRLQQAAETRGLRLAGTDITGAGGQPATGQSWAGDRRQPAPAPTPAAPRPAAASVPDSDPADLPPTTRLA